LENQVFLGTGFLTDTNKFGFEVSDQVEEGPPILSWEGFSFGKAR